MNEPTTQSLHVFLVDDSERHWLVAADEEDAWSLYNDPVLAMNEDERDRDEVSITRLNDDELLGVHDDEGERVSQTCREWCIDSGRGLLGSTAY